MGVGFEVCIAQFDGDAAGAVALIAQPRDQLFGEGAQGGLDPCPVAGIALKRGFMAQ